MDKIKTLDTNKHPLWSKRLLWSNLNSNSDNDIKAINFNLGDETEAYHACTIVLKGQTLVLGGKTRPNQVRQ